MSNIEQLGGVPGKIASGVGNAGVFGGAGSALFGWAAGQDLLAVGGFLIGCAGLFINWHHKRAMRRFEAERLELERARLRLDRADPSDPG
ncbi:holin [Pseudodonghicola flavimaris]|uniref:Holin n=1 Tax=Pseudodonghicola flavimaris TaxID=3050036 RepID=A0ABT7EZ48_9RHOB|nr:holin [Pseudodonghicola flavimaris]MDK3017631.1 holin [Pseudodonghicola flavimaris]